MQSLALPVAEAPRLLRGQKPTAETLAGPGMQMTAAPVQMGIFKQTSSLFSRAKNPSARNRETELLREHNHHNYLEIEGHSETHLKKRVGGRMCMMCL